jgi:hypothetical protein
MPRSAPGHNERMLRDTALPPGAPPPSHEMRERAGVRYEAAVWPGPALAELAGALAAGASALAGLSTDRLLAAWADTVARFSAPSSPERRRLAAALPALCRLSPAGLDAGLEVVLGGVESEPAGRLLAEAARRTESAPPSGGPVLVVLAGNLPALAVQPLLTLLALRRPVLLKSSSTEPLFAPAFVAALGEREPALAAAIAAVTWEGGDHAREAGVLAGVERIVAYGWGAALADLERRAPGKVIGYGPKTSLAVIAKDAVTPETAAALASDVALFDQRGCLSVTAVYTDGDAPHLARLLARELAHLAHRWPPGPATPAELSAVQQQRLEAQLAGCDLHAVEKIQVGKNQEASEPSIAAGTVMIDFNPSFRGPSGPRCVRIHPLPDLADLPALLAPWQGFLQGAALAGNFAHPLATPLTALGVSRIAPPGALQHPDALWHNGGVHPLDILAPATPRR